MFRDKFRAILLGSTLNTLITASIALLGGGHFAIAGQGDADLKSTRDSIEYNTNNLPACDGCPWNKSYFDRLYSTASNQKTSTEKIELILRELSAKWDSNVLNSQNSSELRATGYYFVKIYDDVYTPRLKADSRKKNQQGQHVPVDDSKQKDSVAWSSDPLIEANQPTASGTPPQDWRSDFFEFVKHQQDTPEQAIPGPEADLFRLNHDALERAQKRNFDSPSLTQSASDAAARAARAAAEASNAANQARILPPQTGGLDAALVGLESSASIYAQRARSNEENQTASAVYVKSAKVSARPTRPSDVTGTTSR